MTKAEIIRRLSRKAGVPDAEAKAFFEIFLRKVSKLLNPGEAVSIKNFGFFQLRQGKIRNISAPADEEFKEVIYSDLIVYNSFEGAEQENEEMLIFNVPSSKEAEYNPIDAYFSLSIGKPVIPLKGVKSSEFFIPPTGIELRRLLESKTDNLLSGTEIIKDYTKGSEFLLINSESYNANQYEFNWDELSSIKEETEEILNEVPWDFGDEVSEYLGKMDDKESDSVILSANFEQASDENEELPELLEENVSWDFGSDYFDKEEPVESEEFEDSDEEINAKRDDSAWDLIEQEDVEYSDRMIEPDETDEPVQNMEDEEPHHEPDEDITGNFQRVKSLTREYFKGKDVNKKPDENVSWNFGETSEPGEQRRTTGSSLYSAYEQTDEKGFTEVRNKRRTFDFSITPDEEERLNSIEIDEGDESANADVTTDFYQDEPDVKIEEQPQPRQEKEYKTLTRERNVYSKRSSTPVFIFALSVIILVGAALFIFLRDGGMLKSSEEKTAAQMALSSSAMVIDRTYDIPVTYPYTRNEDNVVSPDIDLPVKKPSENIEQKVEIQKPASEQSKQVKTQAASSYAAPAATRESGVKVRENLYKTGDTYTIQVSSWKSEDIANREVQKFRNQGLDAFVEKAQIPGRGTWYRVKIGNLKTQAEAQKYINQ